MSRSSGAAKLSVSSRPGSGTGIGSQASPTPSVSESIWVVSQTPTIGVQSSFCVHIAPTLPAVQVPRPAKF
jgi:hypothetical protein